MNNLSDFIGTFKDGFQRAARFKAQFFVPVNLLGHIILQATIDEAIDILIPGGGANLRSFLSAPKVSEWLGRGLLCEATRLPSRGLETVDQHIYGFSERFPFSTEYTGLDCSFSMPLIGSDAGVPRFFNYWQNYIHDGQKGPESGYNFRFPSEYYGTVLLSLLDTKNRATITYQFDKCYPKTIESSPVSWEENNAFLKLQVSFLYSYWKVVPYTPVPVF